jgi:hypothetical protein
MGEREMHSSLKRSLTNNRVFGLIALIVGIVCLLESHRLRPLGQGSLTGDHALLAVTGIALAVFAALLLFVLKHTPFKPEFPEKSMFIRLIKSLVILALYSVSVSYLGFVLPTLIYGVFLFRLFGNYIWLKCLFISGISTAGLYLVFIYGLGMNFPRGIF